MPWKTKCDRCKTGMPTHKDGDTQYCCVCHVIISGKPNKEHEGCMVAYKNIVAISVTESIGKNTVVITDYELDHLIIGYFIPFGGIEESIKSLPNKFKKLTPFTGNGHDPNWSWDRCELSKLSTEDKNELLSILRLNYVTELIKKKTEAI